ncbi:hypothetical protein JY651_08105 [Pyxidicoccus parkwayensis]|uniref:Uncharacterized protein n=1 Tax=Pyxidicoccus parkwayensis TaxID=2813578 RepID=A0ABX7P349_9BACT|nr:hypothetical protein [Pyxidicoccus parkwaysis]QSQ24890.1 hypothetical protein JY651_08105 [Pyxidicoccus parkwaysis]
MGAVTAALKEDVMPMFERRGPLDVIIQKPARLPKREWLKLQVVRNREREANAVSPFTGRKVSRNDALWAIVVRGLAAYEAEHGPISVSDEDGIEDDEETPVERSGARPVAKKGAGPKAKK